MHVLIVEVDGEAAESIARKLCTLGHTSVTVGTIVDAAAEAAPLKTPPSPSVDVAIVNANLPRGNAGKLMPMLAELGIRGIAIVSRDSEWDAMKAAGFLFHLPTPVTLADLRALFVPIEGERSRNVARRPARALNPFIGGGAKKQSAKGKKRKS